MQSPKPPVTVASYTPDHAETWSTLVRESRNGTFLFERAYMDYHADRFVDASAMVRRGDELVGLFPASLHERRVVSHGGLTYGGLILEDDVGGAVVLEGYRALVEHYRGRADTLVVKTVPHIYHRRCAEDELYALTRLGFQLTRRDLSSTIDLKSEPALRLTKGRKWGINRAKKLGYQVVESRAFTAFMQLEAEVLQSRHDTTPVHSGAEMELLASRFPQRIRLFVAEKEGRFDAGVLVYDCGVTVHAQYIAANEAGRDACATDFIISDLVSRVFPHARFFDFGISTTHQGTVLNEGLLAFKESFGARSTVYDHYTLALGAS